MRKVFSRVRHSKLIHLVPRQIRTARAFWVRTRQGQLAEAMPRVRKLIADAESTILESNSVLRFLQPDLSLAVLDPTIADFKPSALRYLDRTDALIVPAGTTLESLTQAWPGISPRILADKPLFFTHPPDDYTAAGLASFLVKTTAWNGRNGG